MIEHAPRPVVPLLRPAGPAPRAEDGTSLERTHLVGVGGAGMSGIARILRDRGFAVSGSDARTSDVTNALVGLGVLVVVGHDAGNLEHLDGGPTAVVVSTAVRPDNPEVLAARERGIPVLRRATALAALMQDRRAVCVAGTHGKTSTTSMLTAALQHAGLDPSYAVGGELTAPSGAGPEGSAPGLPGSRDGAGDIFVAEADESDGSFLAFAPHAAVVTNLEPDHLDHHGSAEAYAAVFDAFVGRVTPGGFLVACGDDPGSRALADRVSAGSGPAGLRRVIRYGEDPSGDVVLRDLALGGGGASGTVIAGDRKPVRLTLTAPGRHMLLNATAAFATGVELGVDPTLLADGLAAYRGVRRRFERKGTAGGVTVFDDYAHHPTEVAAQLEAARTLVPGTGSEGGAGRLVVLFQPHLYSRTASFAPAFARALAAADVAVVMDVYGAREDPVPGVTGALITSAMSAAGPAGGVAVHYLPDRAGTAAALANVVRPGDVVVTMGAGDVTTVGPELLALLEAR